MGPAPAVAAVRLAVRRALTSVEAGELEDHAVGRVVGAREQMLQAGRWPGSTSSPFSLAGPEPSPYRQGRPAEEAYHMRAYTAMNYLSPRAKWVIAV